MSTQKLEYICNVVPIGYDTCITNSSTHSVNIDNLKIDDSTRDYILMDQSHIVAIINPSDNNNVNSFSQSNLVLDTAFLVMELASREFDNAIFGRRFRVLISNEYTSCTRKLSNVELLCCYSIPKKYINGYINDHNYTKLCDNNVHYYIPINMRVSITNSLINHAGFTDDITFSANESSDNVQCYHITKSPTILD